MSHPDPYVCVCVCVYNRNFWVVWYTCWFSMKFVILASVIIMLCILWPGQTTMGAITVNKILGVNSLTEFQIILYISYITQVSDTGSWESLVIIVIYQNYNDFFCCNLFKISWDCFWRIVLCLEHLMFFYRPVTRQNDNNAFILLC